MVCFGLMNQVVGERLTYRLRMMSFRHIFRQEMGFFDETQNNPRSLSTHLALDTANVKSATTTVIFGFFCFSFHVALLVLFNHSFACVPHQKS